MKMMNEKIDEIGEQANKTALLIDDENEKIINENYKLINKKKINDNNENYNKLANANEKIKEGFEQQSVEPGQSNNFLSQGNYQDGSKYLNVSSSEKINYINKENKKAFDVASKVMHKVFTDNILNEKNSYINLSTDDNFAENAPVASRVMQRSDEPRPHGHPGSSPGWGDSASVKNSVDNHVNNNGELINNEIDAIDEIGEQSNKTALLIDDENELINTCESALRFLMVLTKFIPETEGFVINENQIINPKKIKERGNERKRRKNE